MGEAMRERVRIRDIRPSQTNPREEFGDIAALAETIRATGGEPVNLPVLVRDGNVYRIVDGERCYRALCEIYGKGSDCEVAALVFDGWGEADEAVAMMATDDKRSLSERERARGVQQMLTLGVDEERAARASRATGAQVSAARKVARLVPEGVQPTLDQMLAASELPEEDAERVLAASNWQWEVADIRERDRKARRREQIRRALERAGVAVADGPGEGMAKVDTRWDYSGVKIADFATFAGRLPEGGVAVVRDGSVELWLPDGASLAPAPDSDVDDPERERRAATVESLRRRALRFAVLGDVPYTVELADRVRRSLRGVEWQVTNALEDAGLSEDFSAMLEAEEVSRFELRMALVEDAARLSAPKRSKWDDNGTIMRRAARDVLDAMDLLAVSGLELDGADDAWLRDACLAIADGAEA